METFTVALFITTFMSELQRFEKKRKVVLVAKINKHYQIFMVSLPYKYHYDSRREDQSFRPLSQPQTPPIDWMVSMLNKPPSLSGFW